MQTMKLLLWIMTWQVPMFMGSQIVRNNMDWYHSLNHPFFSPPDWIFGMVWAVLYLLLAVAGFCITRKGLDDTNRKATWLMLIQLVLNSMWTPLFFGMHYLMGSMVLVLLMLIMTIWLMRAAKPISKTAVWVLIPYLTWLCFAWVMNTSIWIMN